MIKSRSDAAHNYEDSVIDVLVDAVINRYYPLFADFYRKMDAIRIAADA